MSWPRVIVCLDVAGGRVVKGTRFRALRDQGDLLELAARYADDGADEITFLDVEASAGAVARGTKLDWVRRVAEALFIPFSVGGGVRTWEDAMRLFDAGADRVSIGTAAVDDPDVLTRIAERAGRQAVILSVDARHVTADRCVVTRRGGRDETALDARAFAVTGAAAGAGEILLNVIDADGTRDGFDVAYTRSVADAVDVPVIASGGAGTPADFLAVLGAGRAQAALGAGMFHDGSWRVGDVKAYLRERGLEVRPC